MRFWLLFFSLFCCFHLGAQNIIRGVVKSDNGEAIAFASVILLDSDTTNAVSYTLADEKGSYLLNLPDRTNKCWVQVQALGYKSKKKKVPQAYNNEPIKIEFILEKSPYTLKEVIIKSQHTGISFTGDTISYDPKRFMDGSEVFLGDLLNKMPGIEVDQNGNIKMQGKVIEKVLLNGQDFFSNNTQIATKNLSADIVEKIEVLKNYTEYSLLKQYQSEQKAVINIKVNKDKLGKTTGNIQAGGGIRSKYTSRASLIRLMPKMMFSFIGSSNNVGEATLNFEEYMKLQGGINEVLGYEPSGGAVSINLTEEESNMLRPENNTYANTRGLSALNMSYYPTSKLKLNSYILYNGEKTKVKDLIKNTYPTDGLDPVSNLKELQNKGSVGMSSGYLNLTYNMSETSAINYKGSVSNLSSNKRNFISEEYNNNGLNTNDYKKNTGWTLSQNFSLVKAFGKHILTTNVIHSNKNSLSIYNMETDSLLLPLNLIKNNGWYYAQQEIEERVSNTVLDVSFLYHINDYYFLKSKISPKIIENIYQTNIYQNITNDLANDNFRNDYRIGIHHYPTFISLVKNKGLFRFKLGLTTSNYTFNHSLTENVDNKAKFRIQPDIEFSLFFNQRHSIKLSYNQSYSPISASSYISNLVFSQYNSYSQQSDVKKTIYRNEGFQIQYDLYNMFSNTMIYVIGGLNNMYDLETYRFSQDGLLTILEPTLSPRTKNWFGALYLNKGLGFIPWSLEINGDYENNTSRNYSESLENIITNEKFEGKLSLNSRLKKMFNFDCLYQYKLAQNFSSKENRSIQRVHSIGGKVKYNNRKKIRAYLELSYLSNQTSFFNKNLWEINTSFRYFLNKKLELEISGSNILHINKHDWIESSFNGIYMTERLFRQIPGNIVLKLNYKIM